MSKLFFLKLFLLLQIILASNGIFAQEFVVSYCSNLPAITQSNIYGPMYSVATANATSRIAIIYPATDLTTLSGTYLDSVYFHTGAGHASGMLGSNANLKIYFKTVTVSDWGTSALTWATETTGATLVFDGNPASYIGTGGGWKKFPLMTSFQYSGSQNLAVFIEYTNPSASNAITWSYDYNYSGTCVSTNGNTTKYTNNTTGTLPATLSSSNLRRPYIGFDYTLPPCTAPVNAGTATISDTTICFNQNVDLNITGNTFGSGQTYQWQTSTTNAGPWINFGLPQAGTSLTYLPTVTGYTYFRVIATCGTNSDTSSVTRTNVATPFPSGNYTINNLAPASATNFINFSSAIAAISCGISGPITFNVAPGSGPYTENITIPNINNSASSRVRILGNGATVQFAPTTNYTGLLMLDGAQYITIDSINFVSTSSTYGFGAILYNSCAYDSITRCTFDLSTVTATSSANSMGIRISSGVSTTSSTLYGATQCYFGKNKIIGTTGSGGPYYGIYHYGNGENNIFDRNLISNFYYYGNSDYYSVNTQYLYNTFTRQTKTTSAAGGYYGLYNSNMNGGKIIGNKLEYLGGPLQNNNYCYPFNVLNSNGTATNRILVANNIIVNNTNSAYYGIRLSACSYLDLVHNTVDLAHPVTYTNANYGLYTTGTISNVNILNNNISITGGGTSTKYGLYYGTMTNTISDYNNVYVNSTQSGTQAYGYSGSARNTLALFQSNTTYEANGTSEDPQFTNAAIGNFLPTNNNLRSSGTSGTGITTDILGNPRKQFPTPGAYEIPLIVGNNLNLKEIVTPVGNYCSGVQPVKIAISNEGTTQLSNFQINWQVNNVAQTPYSYTGTLDTFLGSGKQIDTITIGSVNIPSGNSNIIVWSNLTVDNDRSNDTIMETFTTQNMIVSSAMDTICYNKDITLLVTPNNDYATGSLNWESSTDGITFSTIPNTSDLTDYNATNLVANTWFRTKISYNGVTCFSNNKKIEINEPIIVNTLPDTLCGMGTATLGATTNGNNVIKWYSSPTSDTILHVGNTFTTPSITSDTTYYAEASTSSGTLHSVGPVDMSIGAFGAWTATAQWLNFRVLAPTTIQSVDVFFSGTLGSPFTIDIRDSVTGATVFTYSGTITQVSTTIPQTVTLAANMNIPGSYQMNMTTNPGTYRNSTGGVYPYTIPNVLSIIGNTFDPVYYYMFYNWKVGTPACSGPRVPVTVTMANPPNVNLGNDTTICDNATTSLLLDAGNPGATYLWNDNTTNQTKAITASGTYSVMVTENGCSSTDAITVNFGSTPTINLGNDTTICSGSTIVLDAGNHSNSFYLWDNASSSQTRTVTTAGTYYVTVVSHGICTSSDTIDINVENSPVVFLGNDTMICSNTNLVLNAGNPGSTYLWDNASNQQQRTVNAAGSYSVLVTTANGCIGGDTINVAIVPLPTGTFSFIQVSNSSFDFTANSANATQHIWDFGDGSPRVTGTNVTHTYQNHGLYTVTLTVKNDCGDSINYSQSVQTTSVASSNFNQDIRLYPNPVDHYLKIESKDAKIQGIKIYNTLGALVHTKTYNNENNVTLNLQGYSDGIYQLHIETSQGTLIQKVIKN